MHDSVYEPSESVLRLAARELASDPDATLGSLFYRFTASEAASAEMTAFAFGGPAQESDLCFLDQVIVMHVMEFGGSTRLDAFLRASAADPYLTALYAA